MRLQRSLPPRFDQVGERVAAVLLGFPEAVVQHREIGRNPNRSFAARVSDVSHAGLSELVQPRRMQWQKFESGVCACCTGDFAAQRIPLFRTFSRVDLGRIQTAHSLQSVSTIERRDEVNFRCGCANACFRNGSLNFLDQIAKRKPHSCAEKTLWCSGPRANHHRDFSR